MSHPPGSQTTVVITGGPQGGKSTLLRRLQADPEVRDLLTVVPEAATILWLNGHPLPDASWGDEQWSRLQEAITALQLSLEQSLGGRTALTICDRAPFDNLAYPFGEAALRLLMGEDYMAQMSRYDMVVHMESLATGEPHRFGGPMVGGTEGRYEHLAEAQDLEMKTRSVWQSHPNWRFVGAARPFAEVLDEASSLIKAHLSAVLGRPR